MLQGISFAIVRSECGPNPCTEITARARISSPRFAVRGCNPSQVAEKLASVVGKDLALMREELRQRSRKFLSRVPVGRVYEHQEQETIQSSVANRPAKIGALQTNEHSTYYLTVEGEVLLSSEDTDTVRVQQLVQRLVQEADRLENMHLHGRDQKLEIFKSDLEKEMKHAT